MKMTSELTLRPLRSEMGIFTQPDGSCSWYQGGTAMLAAVYGPGDVRQNAELVDRATVEVIYQPAAGMTSMCAYRFDEHLILETCRAILISTLHPRTAVNVVIQEVTDSGSRLAASVNAACLALLDAGIVMRQTVAAICAVVTPDGDIVIDPATQRETNATACMMFAFGSDKALLSCRAEGMYTDEQYQHALLSCRNASRGVFDFYRQAVTAKLNGDHNKTTL